MRVLLALVIAGLTTGATPLPARAQQGVTDAEILLGGSNSFSGPLAFTGEQATRFGVDLYFKAVNDGGGIHGRKVRTVYYDRSEEHTSELQSRLHLVCRLLLEKKK